jgi:hypothetical protein
MLEDLPIANDAITISSDRLGDRDRSTPIAIAQSHLSNWQICRRKFQHTYIDSLNTPISSDQEKKMQLGQKFHLLMQQRELGLEVEQIAANPQNQFGSHAQVRIFRY